MKEFYTTISEAIADLQQQGYMLDYNLKGQGLLKDWPIKQETENLEVVKFYRFESKSNPADSRILYVLENAAGKKGLLVDAYGADSSNLAPEKIHRMNILR
ncbi:MAG: phosphoribosylpyrophosphate synthetase [Bacteroidetes bacterium HGW-Bacteroidetes-2]|nr:MAG: phosphoribosylpyrophosphate synthetase [Bacteroidetes bacterium HGW-Bacteroidetes-2]